MQIEEMDSLLATTDRGLYCKTGDFYIDPWQPVDRAIITHAHADHVRWGCGSYLCAAVGSDVLRLRLGPDATIESVGYGEARMINGVRVSLHPAGHILGSAQVRLDRDGEVWVVSGDYKTEADTSLGAFELVRCHTFITESTFGLPIFRWRPESSVMADINAWWRRNAAEGVNSVLYAYALGKAQRVLASVDRDIGPILVHGAVYRFLGAYRAQGVDLPDVARAETGNVAAAAGRALVIAPPGADTTGWLRKFGAVRTAFASGWMQVRRLRVGRGVDTGFALSDHADWDAILATIDATGAENVGVTHGFADSLVRYLGERGKNAWVVPSGRATAGDDEDWPNKTA